MRKYPENAKMPTSDFIFEPKGMVESNWKSLFFMVVDHHKEYELPKSTYIRTRYAFEPYDLEEALSYGYKDRGLIDSMVEKCYKGILEDRNMLTEENSESIVACGGDEPSTLLRVEFDISNSLSKYGLPSYLESCFHSAIEAYHTASGDDATFDYMPNYLLMVMEILSFTGNQQYADFLGLLANSVEDLE